MTDSNWDTFARVNAGERYRAQSAAIGSQVTKAIVEEARIVPGLRVLDVACGSGEPAISIAALLQGSGQVVGIDISAQPLQVARERASRRGLDNVEFLQADIHQLPFPDGSFDRAVSRFGVMFFSDLPRALRELHRVLKPGGRTSHLAWGSMRQPYFETTVGVVLEMLPELSLPASGRGMFQFGEPGTLTARLQEAGFTGIEEKVEKVPWNWPGTPEELWAYFQDVTIPLKPVLQAIPADRQDIHRVVLDALRARYDGQQVKFDAAIVLASGRR
ncbi:MAG: methyltransferase domain-containing protein [Candidatus Korobacteraceae bacterium]|jgi:SAM-dependent methyltransferase